MSADERGDETILRKDDESLFEYHRRLKSIAWNRRLDAIDTLAKAGDTVGAISRLVELLREDVVITPSTGKAEPPPGYKPGP